MLAAALAVAGTVTVGAIGADDATGEAAPQTVYTSETGGNCFTPSSSRPPCPDRGDVAVNTGEAVTWNFDGVNVAHNAAATGPDAEDPEWGEFAGDFVTSGSYSYTFNRPGTFDYYCQAHPEMVGTVTVTGEPVETPTETPTETATSTATATASPTSTATASPQPGGGQTTTPPPSGGQDSVKPTVKRFSVKALRRAARVRFRLSESSTVAIRVKRGSKVVKSVVLQMRAGNRTVTVRSKKLKKGRYTVEVRARDAVGNRSTVASKRLRIKR